MAKAAACKFPHPSSSPIPGHPGKSGGPCLLRKEDGWGWGRFPSFSEMNQVEASRMTGGDEPQSGGGSLREGWSQCGGGWNRDREVGASQRGHWRGWGPLCCSLSGCLVCPRLGGALVLWSLSSVSVGAPMSFPKAVFSSRGATWVGHPAQGERQGALIPLEIRMPHVGPLLQPA